MLNVTRQIKVINKEKVRYRVFAELKRKSKFKQYDGSVAVVDMLSCLFRAVFVITSFISKSFTTKRETTAGAQTKQITYLLNRTPVCYRLIYYWTCAKFNTTIARLYSENTLYPHFRAWLHSWSHQIINKRRTPSKIIGHTVYYSP